MEVHLHTNINGYFAYNIFSETPDNVTYKSPEYKNLILDTGLSHLYNKSVDECIRVIDFGISNKRVESTQTGVVSSAYPNATLFTNLSALNYKSTIDYENSKTIFTSFFRTNTTLRDLSLQEFSIKPSAFESGFSRQLLDIPLKGGDGIEFSYRVEVDWPEYTNVNDFEISYRLGLEGNEYNATPATFPTDWTIAEGISGMNGTGIASDGSNIVVVSSGETDPKNVMFSLDTGETWSPIATNLSTLNFNDVVNGYDESLEINKFVAVGDGRVAYTTYNITQWYVAFPAYTTNWTGVTYGKIIDDTAAGTFVAVADSGTARVMYSTTAADWTSGGSDNITGNSEWSSVTYGPVGGFVAVAAAGSNPQVAFSKDAITWLSAGSPEDNNWRDVTYGNGRYVAISNDGANRIMYADESNLTSWLSASTPYPNNWQGIEFGNNLFVAIASGGTDSSMHSVNGIDWLPNNSNIGSKPWVSLTSTGSGGFIAVSNINEYESIVSHTKYIPTVYPTTVTSVSSTLIKIPLSGHVYNRDYLLYTLSGMDMPIEPTSGAYLPHINFSTGSEENSYTQSDDTLMYPNTAINTFHFDHLNGYGPIKGGIITHGRIEDRTYTTYNTDGTKVVQILPGIENGVWLFKWNIPRVLQGTQATTGPLESTYIITPEPGSLVKPMFSETGDQYAEDLSLTINVIHTWGLYRG